MLLLAAFSFWGFVQTLLMVVFVLSALLLMLVVLLQEPKGGGLSSAFGGAGAETFGVQTGSVNRFTAWVAAVFMATALLYAAAPHDEDSSMLDQPTTEEKSDDGGGDNAKPAGTGEKPAEGAGAPADQGSDGK